MLSLKNFNRRKWDKITAHYPAAVKWRRTTKAILTSDWKLFCPASAKLIILLLCLIENADRITCGKTGDSKEIKNKVKRGKLLLCKTDTAIRTRPVGPSVIPK